MRIKTIRIENFRSFLDEIIELNPYSCFVGPNGAGKSTVLTALNVFFQERASSSTDVSKLSIEDYYSGDPTKPIKITLTFNELSDAAQVELDTYVRNGELVVTAEAVFDHVIGFGQVRHFGQRFGMEKFRQFFDKMKDGASATDLNSIYKDLQGLFTDLPAARSKDDKADALRLYESEHLSECVQIPSADSFYGINSTGGSPAE